MRTIGAAACQVLPLSLDRQWRGSSVIRPAGPRFADVGPRRVFPDRGEPNPADAEIAATILED
jgi:hypothetical protein